jgi:bifunctional DNA-binding transcriptional regulator/antitoxin component of YhaV-PrlF toxin-antitoxin module
MSQVIKVSLDDLGRISIPAAVKRRLGLSPGMNLVVKAEPVGDLTNITRHERDRHVSDLLQRVDS